MTVWAALGGVDGGVRAIAMQGARVTARADAPDEAAALARLGAAPARILRIGEGSPARLPAPVLPAAGTDLPGFVQDSPPEVIGGWVRLWLAGFQALHPRWDGVICATDGDVRHWIHISADEAVSAQGVLTPRLIRALDGAAMPDMGAVADSLSRPERLAAHLYVAQVTGNAAAVSGHLIGAELAAARVYWLGQQVAVLAPPPAPVAAALQSQGVPCSVHDPETLLAPGLAAVGAALGLTG